MSNTTTVAITLPQIGVACADGVATADAVAYALKKIAQNNMQAIIRYAEDYMTEREAEVRDPQDMWAAIDEIFHKGGV